MKTILQRRPSAYLKKPLSLFSAISISFIVLFNTNAASAAIKPLTSAAAVEQINVAEASSLAKMQSALERMLASAKQTTTNTQPDFKLQEALITASGATAGKIFSLYQSGLQSTERRKQSENLLLKNRELLQNLHTHNEAVIRNYQEHELDKMADPVKFFESEQWQMPQQLISLASYWSGWNGYYASLLMDAELPLRQTVLHESIEAFSRSFIDFAEDEITTKSLYGRGLVYKQLNIFGRAAYDFKSVKQRVGAEHPLYLSCLYQEALISYESGNIKIAKAILKNVQGNYLREDIPEFIRLGIKRLEAQFILDPDADNSIASQKIAKSSDKKSISKADRPNENIKPSQASNKETGESLSYADIHARFVEIKTVAKNDLELFGEFYRYSKKHAATLGSLSYKALTPTAAMAVADSYFESRQFEAAQKIYRKLVADNPKVIRQHADGVWLRSAYIYNHQKNWASAGDLLAKFNEQFPNSNQLNQSAELYYSAAISQQRADKTTSNYNRYIQATKNYVEHCGTCARIDDAYYTMGRHYTKQNKRGPAISAFGKVQPKSSHYFIASFHVAEVQISALESLQRNSETQTDNAKIRYQAVKQIINRYNNAGVTDSPATPLRPNWMLLQARFHLLPFEPNYSAAIAQLDSFDSLISATSKTTNDTTTPLRLSAASIRAIAYQKLGSQKLFEATITQLAQQASGTQPSASSNYETLQRLANRFYQQAGNKTDTPTDITSAANAARFIYRHISNMPASHAAYKPHQFSVQFRLAKLYRQNDQLPQALNIYRELVDQNPDSADALYALADVYRELKQWRDALKIWRQLSDGLPAGSTPWFEARYQTAVSMKNLERADKACSIAKMTRILHPKLDSTKFSSLFQTIEMESCDSN